MSEGLHQQELVFVEKCCCLWDPAACDLFEEKFLLIDHFPDQSPRGGCCLPDMAKRYTSFKKWLSACYWSVRTEHPRVLKHTPLERCLVTDIWGIGKLGLNK